MSLDGHVRSVTSLPRFRQSADDIWVTRAFEAPPLLPARATSVCSVTSLPRFRQSADDIWVIRASAAPTLLPAGVMAVGGHVHAHSDLIALIAS